MTKDGPAIPLKKLQDFYELYYEQIYTHVYIYSYYVTLPSLCNLLEFMFKDDTTSLTLVTSEWQ